MAINTSSNSITIGEIQPHDVIIVTVTPVNIVGTGLYITTSTTGMFINIVYY